MWQLDKRLQLCCCDHMKWNPATEGAVSSLWSCTSWHFHPLVVTGPGQCRSCFPRGLLTDLDMSREWNVCLCVAYHSFQPRHWVLTLKQWWRLAVGAWFTLGLFMCHHLPDRPSGTGIEIKQQRRIHSPDQGRGSSVWVGDVYLYLCLSYGGNNCLWMN